jgi:DNA-binding response OmpR family regulator
VEAGARCYRILIIEDNPADVHLIREALSEKNVPCELDSIDDGEVAMARLNAIEAGDHRAPDAVLLDLNLPKITGDMLLQRMRQCRTLDGVPVIVLTSSDSPRDRGHAQQFGATAYIRKPSNLDEFLAIGEVVQKTLQSR